MSEHRISPATIARYRRFVVKREVAIMVLAFLAIFTVALAQGASLIILAFIILMISLVTISRVARIGRSIEQDLSGYAIELDDDRLTRIPNVTLARGEVTAIEERRGGGLAVWGPERKTMIPVPEMVEGYGEVRRRLSEWRAIERKN